MKTQNKTLLIHMDGPTDKTEAILVEEHNIVQKTKELLHSLSKKYKEAEIKMYSPVGVVLKSAENSDNYAVAYEQEHFVIVAPNGTSESAKLYGNWEEAIRNVQRWLRGNTSDRKNRFLISEYVKNN